MLEAIFELLFQFVFEVVLEVAAEVLTELGFSRFARAANAARRNPLVAGIGYMVLGILLGGLSTWVVPGNIIQSETLRIVNGFLSPLFLGFMLCLISWIITRRDLGEGLFRLDKFIYGVVFGAFYTLTRSALL
jgi:hypothetical protein